MYAYKHTVLEEITCLPPGHLEKAESLEQLRWLENGYRIKTAETQYESIGIDTPDDLIRALQKDLHWNILKYGKQRFAKYAVYKRKDITWLIHKLFYSE